jgi:hypothetical protein
MASGIRKNKDDRTPYWVQAVFILAFRIRGMPFLTQFIKVYLTPEMISALAPATGFSMLT